MNAVIKTNGRHFTSQLEMDMSDVAKVLLQNGADVNAVIITNGRHFTRTQGGHVDVAKVLLQNGARECCRHVKWTTSLRR